MSSNGQLTARGASAATLHGDDVGAINLRDLTFTDLIMSANGVCFMRGAETGDGPLVAIPDGAVNDLETIRINVINKGQHANEYFVDHDGIRYRVSVINDLDGTWYTLRKSVATIPRIGSLGLPSAIVRHLGKLGKKSGLLLLAGATGQGKTTTAYTLLHEYLMHFGNIAVTIEDPPEMVLNGPRGNHGHCFQLKLEPHETFANALVKSMRYVPRYILLGEIRRPEDADQALRAAISGHLIITTIHAGNVQEAINSLLKLTASGETNLAFARDLLANGLAGVIHQRLQTVKVDNFNKRRLKIQSLFFGNDSGLRALVRDGQIAQLGTAIEQQAKKVQAGREPVE